MVYMHAAEECRDDYAKCTVSSRGVLAGHRHAAALTGSGCQAWGLPADR